MADTWDEAACRARLAAVTPGPWVVRDSRRHPAMFTVPGGMPDWPEGGMCWSILEDAAGDDQGHAVLFGAAHDGEIHPEQADLDFIAHAPVDLGAALAEIDRLREIVRGLSERVAAQSELLSRRAEGRP